MNVLPILIVMLLGAGTAWAQESAPAASAPTEAVKPEPKAAPPVKAVSLEEAYRREYAFLQAQKKELSKRVQAFSAQAVSAEKRLRNKISALEQKNIDLAAQEDRLRTELTESEQKDISSSENDELLDMTFSQANASLA
ncbi:MAG: hypothetical protein RQ715_09510, partial [Methylococcales bacterium]|nr:hypothetical protein [Methylococcales bacterium]